MLGNTLLGNLDSQGNLYNIDHNDDVQDTIVFESDFEDEDLRYALGLNTKLINITKSKSFAFVAEEGINSTEIELMRPEQTRLPDTKGNDPYGHRGYLSWSPSSSPDVVGYNVYLFDVLIDTLDDINIHRQDYAPASTGAGLGRISTAGSYEGAAINETFTITILANNRFETTQYAGKTFPILKQVYLGNNIYVSFHDDATDYAEGDTYSYVIGPPTSYLSGILDNGANPFKITAVDSAGNESAPVTKTIAADKRPLAVSSLAASYDGFEITIAWDQPSDGSIDFYNIYSNYSHVFGQLTEKADVLFVAQSTAEPSIVFEPPVQGEWKFYVRGINAAGIESDSIRMATVNTLEGSSAIDVGEPELIELTKLPAGGFSASFWFDGYAHRDVTAFNIYVANSETLLNNLLAISAPTLSVTDSPQSLKQYSVDIAGNGNSVRWVAIKSFGGGKESSNTDSYMIETDSGVPNAPSNLNGGSE